MKPSQAKPSQAKPSQAKSVAVASAIFVLSSFAQAGHYAVSYVQSGANDMDVKITSPAGVIWGYPYSDDLLGGHGGSGVSSEPPLGSPPGLGSVVCTRDIVIKFDWIPDAGEDPPKTAILTVTSQASWTGHFGSASNGLGDAEILGVSSGTHVTLRSNPGLHWEYMVSPTAQSQTTQVQGNPIPAIASVNVTGSLQPIEIKLDGTWTGAHKFDVMIGQRVNSWLSGAGLTFSSVHWTVPGHLFDRFEVTGTSQEHGHTTLVDPAVWNTASPKWVWSETESIQTVTVTAVAWFGNQMLGPMNAEAKVYVHRPPRNLDTEVFDHVAYDSYAGQERVEAGDWNVTPVLVGIKFLGSVAAYTTTKHGKWGFVQIVEPDRTKSGGTIGYEHIGNGSFWLDTYLPYPFYEPAAQWNLTTSLLQLGSGRKKTSDSPGAGISQCTLFNFFDNFIMFQLYQPNDISVGNLGTEIVPLKRSYWNWLASLSRTSMQVAWTSEDGKYVPGGHVQALGQFEATDHPDWDDNVTLHQ